MSIALKEARETRYWLRLITEAGLIRAELLKDLAREADELTRILAAIVFRCRRTDRWPVFIENWAF
jgi:four helix bundle protein